VKAHIGWLIPIALVAANSALADPAQRPTCGDTPEAFAAMPGFQPAQIVRKPNPVYPDRALDQWSEGWVSIELTVGQDGAPKDITVLDAIGAPEFVIHTVRTVSRWHYKPATQNGAPVEQNLCSVNVIYQFYDTGRTADHDNFVRQYDRARQALRDNKYDEALAAIEPALRKRINLYEIAMGSHVAGIAYAKKGDLANALFHMRHAVIEDLEYLEQEMRPTALSLQAELELRLGNMDEGFRAFERLRQLDPKRTQPDEPLAKLVKRVKDGLSAPGPISIAGRLAKHPLVDAPAVWRHRLLRPSFTFQGIQGDVKTFALVCTNAKHDAAVDDETRWDIPAKAGPCVLRVDGAPGGAFNVVQEWGDQSPVATR
jgi:TonB family protein